MFAELILDVRNTRVDRVLVTPTPAAGRPVSKEPSPICFP